MSFLKFAAFCLAFTAPALFALDEGDLKDEKGEVIVHYAVETPKTMAAAGTTDPAKQVGLFICFHEHGMKAPDETHSLIESLKRLNLSEEYVVIGMKDGTPHGYSMVDDHVRADKLIAWAKKTYPVNPRRVYLWGRGEGAKMVGEFGPEHADIISNIITYSWGFWKTRDVEDPATNIPEFYIVLGMKDLLTHIKTVRETYNRARVKGYNVLYREAEGLGGPTKHQPTNDDSVIWATSSRHKTMALSNEEIALLKAFADFDNSKALPALFANVVLVGGRQAGKALIPAFDSKNEAVRLSAALACDKANFGPDAAAALGKLVADPSADVRKAAIHALGVQGNWRNLPAQEALCKLLTDKAAKSEDRALAVDALGAVVKLQVKGFYQDVPVFKALVSALDDEDAGIRSKVFAILSPAKQSDYKPDAPAADRKTAIEKWNVWLEEIAKPLVIPVIPPKPQTPAKPATPPAK